ncbi:hypothetical protein Tcan_04030 [Toxocara canis]|uniref:Uncharacterized protein n=1 Tax=Toxocara canis TaxID=6265 RepID=A0A0B2VYC8_TOXCA|nr:hypothetical protein Tcan_04030 [Toxocara canis]
MNQAHRRSSTCSIVRRLSRPHDGFTRTSSLICVEWLPFTRPPLRSVSLHLAVALFLLDSSRRADSRLVTYTLFPVIFAESLTLCLRIFVNTLLTPSISLFTFRGIAKVLRRTNLLNREVKADEDRSKRAKLPSTIDGLLGVNGRDERKWNCVHLNDESISMPHTTKSIKIGTIKSITTKSINQYKQLNQINCWLISVFTPP